MKRHPVVLRLGMVFMIFLQACSDPDVNLAVKHYHKGKIIIDSRPLESYQVRKTGFSSGDTLYMFELSKGYHVFDIQISDSMNIKKTVLIQGEAYYGIDFETGEVIGFEE